MTVFYEVTTRAEVFTRVTQLLLSLSKSRLPSFRHIPTLEQSAQIHQD